MKKPYTILNSFYETFTKDEIHPVSKQKITIKHKRLRLILKTNKPWYYLFTCIESSTDNTKILTLYTYILKKHELKNIYGNIDDFDDAHMTQISNNESINMNFEIMGQKIIISENDITLIHSYCNKEIIDTNKFNHFKIETSGFEINTMERSLIIK